MTDYTIRPARLEDMESVNCLRRTPGVFETTLALPSERVRHNVEKFQALGPNDHSFAAVLADGTVIGTAQLKVSPNPRTAHVGTVGLSVRTDYQDMGVGTALMRTLLELADNWLMLVRLELLVDAGNARAIHLYEKLGFETEARLRKSSIRDGRYIDDCLMARLRRSSHGFVQ